MAAVVKGGGERTMTAAGAPGPASPGARAGRLDATPGWVGVALTLMVSFFARFALGEGVSDGFPSFVQMAFVLGCGALAIARPGVGAAVPALPGLVVLICLLVLVHYRLLLTGLPLLLSAALLYPGRTQPKRLAYWVVALIPLAVGLACGPGGGGQFGIFFTPSQGSPLKISAKHTLPKPERTGENSRGNTILPLFWASLALILRRPRPNGIKKMPDSGGARLPGADGTDREGDRPLPYPSKR